MIRVAVADGHALTRLGIVQLLREVGDVCVVGEVDDGPSVLRLAREERPNLVVLDLNLAGEPDRTATCRKIKTLPDPPRVMVHTAYNLTEDNMSCLLMADGYLHKSACCRSFVNMVRLVAAGERVWCAGEAADRPGFDVRVVPCRPQLTPKEQEIVALMFRQRSNAEIADALNLGLPTVKTHVRSVLRKLGAKSRAELFTRLLLGAP